MSSGATCTAIIVCALAAGTAQAQPHFEIIDRGVPTDGTRVMTGYRGFVLRAVSDIGPISQVFLGQDFGGLSGDIAERWTDPSGQGNYTVTSPGPLPFDNTTPSEFNFDSHFLGDPAWYTRAPFENAGFYGFGAERNPIPSDGFVGYGDAPNAFDPFEVDQTRDLGAILAPPSETSSIDVAYVVTNSLVIFSGSIRVDGIRHGDGGQIRVPEPSGLIALICAGAARSIHRGRRGSRRAAASPRPLTLQHPVGGTTGMASRLFYARAQQ